MKRIIYALLIAISSSMAFSGCSEEEVLPAQGDNGGTYPIPDPVR